MLSTWLSESPSVLPKRSTIRVRRLLLIFVVVLYLTFLLAYRLVWLKSFRHLVVEFFDKGVGFC